jgi:hypothetical protein
VTGPNDVAGCCSNFANRRVGALAHSASDKVATAAHQQRQDCGAAEDVQGRIRPQRHCVCTFGQA